MKEREKWERKEGKGGKDERKGKEKIEKKKG